jgi:hypothetical protein
LYIVAPDICTVPNPANKIDVGEHEKNCISFETLDASTRWDIRELRWACHCLSTGSAYQGCPVLDVRVIETNRPATAAGRAESRII